MPEKLTTSETRAESFCRALLSMWRLKALGHSPFRRFKEEYWIDFKALRTNELVEDLNRLDVNASKVNLQTVQEMAYSKGAENSKGCDGAHNFSQWEYAVSLLQAPEPYRSCFERIFFYIFDKPSSEAKDPEPWVGTWCPLSHYRTDLTLLCVIYLQARSALLSSFEIICPATSGRLSSPRSQLKIWPSSLDIHNFVMWIRLQAMWQLTKHLQWHFNSIFKDSPWPSKCDKSL